MGLTANALPVAHSATLLGMLACNIAAAISLPSLCWITIPLAGLAMCSALSAVHECAHRTYFTGRRANDVVGRLWALVILMNFSAYKRAHMFHHRHQGTERDTEPQIAISTRLDLTRAVLFNPHILPSWSASLVAAVYLAPATRNVRRDGQLLLAGKVAAVATLVADWQMAMLVFFLPFALSTVLDNLVSLPEHARITGADQEATTRSMNASWLLGFLLYFVGRHIEHHERPQISVAQATSADSSDPLETYVGFYTRAWRAIPRVTASW